MTNKNPVPLKQQRMNLPEYIQTGREKSAEVPGQGEMRCGEARRKENKELKIEGKKTDKD